MKNILIIKIQKTFKILFIEKTNPLNLPDKINDEETMNLLSSPHYRDPLCNYLSAYNYD